jgi:predicted amidohydrolase YtcJ
MDEPKTDIVIRNAKVWTVDDERPAASALAIAGDRIAWVGDDAEARDRVGAGTLEIDADGHTVMPGVIDSHNHVRLGSGGYAAELHGATTAEEVWRRIDAWIDAHPAAPWVEGEGLPYEAALDGRLEALVEESHTRGRAAFLTTYDAHNAILNRTGLARFGIASDTERVPFGIVHKDPSSGEPTGVIERFAVMGLERKGQAALATELPGSSVDRRYARLVHGLDLATACGITTVVEPQNSLDDLPLFERARSEGKLRPRLVAALFHPPGTTNDELDAFADAARRFDDDRLRAGPIKLYIDDVAEMHTAAFFEPYADDPTTGQLFYEPDEFRALMAKLDGRGFQTFTHAIGDRGIRTVLDALEHARRVNPRRDARHQLVHVECPHPSDVPRFAELDAVACMQPRHFAPDVAAQWRRDVGPERSAWAAPWRSLDRSGAVLAFSSDWNVAEMEPVVGIHTAVTRTDLQGNGTWNTEETVDLPTAIRAYTMGGAYANHCEQTRGSLTPGKDADVIVLSGALFDPGPGGIPGIEVDVTIVGGRVVHTR